MLSKKNVKLMVSRCTPARQRFGLRKLTIGVASVLLGFTFIGGSVVYADSSPEATSHQEETILARQDDIDAATPAMESATSTATVIECPVAGVTESLQLNPEQPASSVNATNNIGGG